MPDKNLVEVVVGDLQRRYAFGRSAANVKDEFVAIAKFDEKTGRGLGRAGGRHTGAAGNHAHFVFGKSLGVRIVDIAICSGFDGRVLSLCLTRHLSAVHSICVSPEVANRRYSG
jgi:hypothetical protein